MNLATPNQTSAHWDIFCTVIDNYGDIGVTWRLAKQLSQEYGMKIRLWVDDLHSFGHILPALDVSLAQQQQQGVEIYHWQTPLMRAWQPGAVLIEAFGCQLPVELLAQLNEVPASNIKWLNLEYLTAETWAEDCHGLPSIQPSGHKKYFYFPGFSEQSGGLICEHELLVTCANWQQTQQRWQYFQQLGLADIQPGERVISVFCYQTPALAALCQYWQQADHKIHLLIPKGRCLQSLDALLPIEAQQCQAGDNFTLGQLNIHVLPMTDQSSYDRLLWSCDLNIVRGEDSFVRAQWAGRPFIWHIYPQQEQAHLVKLDAFLSLYCDNLAPNIARIWCDFTLAFNQDDENQVVTQWQQLDSVISPLAQYAQQWQNTVLTGADLATRLVKFVEKI
jgi:uncharacterized repeat protein (TIGR03837 family)